MQITIQEIQKQWGVARSTIYKHLKNGTLSRQDNGKVDVSEVRRVYGEPSKNTVKDKAKQGIDTNERQLLLDKIALLESQLMQSAKDKEWLKGQVETAQETIKLLEHKQPSPMPTKPTKKGLFGRVVGAVLNQ